MTSNDGLSSSPDWLSRPRVAEPKSFAPAQVIQHGFKIKSQDDFAADPSNFSESFFQSILVGDEFQREEAISCVLDVLDNALYNNDLDFLRAHIGTIVRLSTGCPFTNVRTALLEFINRVKENDLDIVIPHSTSDYSSFFDESDDPLPFLLENEDLGPEIVAKLCRIAFLQKGRVSHIVRLISWHPIYLEKFYQTYDHLMFETGALTVDWRSYIAIIGSSRHYCKYLITSQEKEFQDSGGDSTWLRGLSSAPPKLQALSKLNAILAHQPWLLQSKHIAELCTGGTDNWSLNELVQAMIILTTFHSLSGIVNGCGLLPEVEEEVSSTQNSTESSSSEEEKDIGTNITKKLFEALSSSDDSDLTPGQKKLFEIVDEKSIPNETFKKYCIIAPSITSSKQHPALKYRGSLSLEHSDFVINSQNYTVFHFSDYRWKDQGYAMVNEYYPTIAPLLDEEFRTIYNLTYRTFSDNDNVDTARFRSAVWHYVHRVQGIFHDDYSYNSVNFWLNRRLKTYIKKLVCFPKDIKKADFQNMGIDLHHHEKVHLSLLATTARKQAALLYGLRAIMQYQAESGRIN